MKPTGLCAWSGKAAECSCVSLMQQRPGQVGVVCLALKALVQGRV